MTHFDVQQNAYAISDETRPALASQNIENVFCPKPRRVGDLFNNPTRPLRCHMSNGAELSESKKRADILDMILTMEHSGTEQSVAQPFLHGSPPSRSANPLIQDDRFGEAKAIPLSPFSLSSPSGLLSPTSSSTREGGCGGGTKFGLKPATVRIEGFDYLDRNSGITVVA